MPYLPDALVLAVGQDELLPRVEDGAANIVVVAAAGINLPGLQQHHQRHVVNKRHET